MSAKYYEKITDIQKSFEIWKSKNCFLRSKSSDLFATIFHISNAF